MFYKIDIIVFLKHFSFWLAVLLIGFIIYVGMGGRVHASGLPDSDDGCPVGWKAKDNTCQLGPDNDGKMYTVPKSIIGRHAQDYKTDPEFKHEKGRIIIEDPKEDNCQARPQKRSNEITFDCPDMPPTDPANAELLDELKHDLDKYPNADCLEEIDGRVYPCMRRYQPKKEDQPKYAPDKVGVTYLEGTTEAQKKEYREHYKLEKEKQMYEIPNSDFLTITDGTDPVEFCNLSKQSYPSIIRSCDPEWSAKLQGSYIPRDTYWPEQWGPKKIGLPGAWYALQYPSGINYWWSDSLTPIAAIIDSGHKYGILDFKDSNVIGGCAFYVSFTSCKPPIDPNLYGDHGIGVTTTIGATKNNGFGIAGVYDRAKFLEYRVCDYDNCSAEAVTLSIYDAVAKGAFAINLSLEVHGDYLRLHDAIKYAVARNVLVICAAGNEGWNLAIYMAYPAIYPECMTIAATDRNDNIVPVGDYHGTHWGSNYGFNISMSAPGEAQAFGSFDSYLVYDWQGTSFSTAYVTGVALMLKDRYPTASAAKIRHCLEAAAYPIAGCPKFMCGAGRLDANKAIKTACV